MAASILSALGIDAELLEGSGGVFDVRADGKLVFSKDEMGRFPADDEVIALLQG